MGAVERALKDQEEGKALISISKTDFATPLLGICDPETI